jgi:hypothetical protein
LEWSDGPTLILSAQHLAPLKSQSQSIGASPVNTQSGNRLTSLGILMLKSFGAEAQWDLGSSFSISQVEERTVPMGASEYSVGPHLARAYTLGLGRIIETFRLGVLLSQQEIAVRELTGAVQGRMPKGEKTILSLDFSTRFNEELAFFANLFDESLIGRPREVPLNRGIQIGFDYLRF